MSDEIRCDGMPCVGTSYVRLLTAERDSARSIAVRLEQELAQALALGFEAGKAFAQDEAATERLRATMTAASPNGLQDESEPMTPTDKAVALLKSIGLDITYTDDGLRVVAEQIGETYRADEREQARERIHLEQAADAVYTRIWDEDEMRLLDRAYTRAALVAGGDHVR